MTSNFKQNMRTIAKQVEINRLRKVLHEIANSQPNEHMSIEKNPELVNWICDTCEKARVGAYPKLKSYD
jgi:hypothetical protein